MNTTDCLHRKMHAQPMTVVFTLLYFTTLCGLTVIVLYTFLVCTDEVEVAYLKDITKEDLVKFFQASVCMHHTGCLAVWSVRVNVQIFNW